MQNNLTLWDVVTNAVPGGVALGLTILLLNGDIAKLLLSTVATGRVGVATILFLTAYVVGTGLQEVSRKVDDTVVDMSSRDERSFFQLLEKGRCAGNNNQWPLERKFEHVSQLELAFKNVENYEDIHQRFDQHELLRLVKSYVHQHGGNTSRRFQRLSIYYRVMYVVTGVGGVAVLLSSLLSHVLPEYSSLVSGLTGVVVGLITLGFAFVFFDQSLYFREREVEALMDEFYVTALTGSS